jgi:hypothetical protein
LEVEQLLFFIMLVLLATPNTPNTMDDKL